MNQEQYFGLANQLARDPGVARGHPYFRMHRSRLWKMGEHFGLWSLQEKEILEIGPFYSYAPFALRQQGNAVTVLEGPDPAIEPLRNVYARHQVEFVITDLFEALQNRAAHTHALPFSDGQFDVVNCWETMEHFNFNPLGFVRELYRVLKPGGVAFITVPNMAALECRIKLLLGRSVRTPIADYRKYYEYDGGRFLGFHWREYTLKEMDDLFSGLRGIQDHVFSLSPDISRPRKYELGQEGQPSGSKNIVQADAVNGNHLLYSSRQAGFVLNRLNVDPPEESMTTRDLQALREQFIQSAGHASQMLGFGRIIGQIYMHIYFAREPVSLDDLTRDLGISKGSASMAVRQLEVWGALRRISVKGDRKDYYEPRDEFGRIIRKAFIDLVGQRMETADQLFEHAEASLNGKSKGDTADEELQFFKQRVGKLRDFRRRAQGLWESPVIRMLIK